MARMMTPQQIQEIRWLREQGKLSYNKIALKYNLTGEFVRKVCMGLYYKDIKGKRQPRGTTK